MKKFKEYITEASSSQLKKEFNQSVIYNIKTKEQIGDVFPNSKSAHNALSKIKDNSDLKVSSLLFFIDNIKK